MSQSDVQCVSKKKTIHCVCVYKYIYTHTKMLVPKNIII